MPVQDHVGGDDGRDAGEQTAAAELLLAHARLLDEVGDGRGLLASTSCTRWRAAGTMAAMACGRPGPASTNSAAGTSPGEPSSSTVTGYSAAGTPLRDTSHGLAAPPDALRVRSGVDLEQPAATSVVGDSRDASPARCPEPSQHRSSEMDSLAPGTQTPRDAPPVAHRPRSARPQRRGGARGSARSDDPRAGDAGSSCGELDDGSHPRPAAVPRWCRVARRVGRLRMGWISARPGAVDVRSRRSGGIRTPETATCHPHPPRNSLHVVPAGPWSIQRQPGRLVDLHRPGRRRRRRSARPARSRDACCRAPRTRVAPGLPMVPPSRRAATPGDAANRSRREDHLR